MKTLNVAESAEFLHISVDTLKKKLASGLIPGAKIGKEWICTDEALEEHVRQEIKRQTKERGGHQPAEQPIQRRRQARVPPMLGVRS